MGTLILAALFVVVAAANSCVQPLAPVPVKGVASGKVTIWTINPLDLTELPGTVELIASDPEQSAQRFASGKTVDVPLGTYTARLRASGFSEETFELNLYGPSISIRVALHSGIACLSGTPVSVRGVFRVYATGMIFG